MLKIKSDIRIIIFSVLLLLILAVNVYSQGVDIRSGELKHTYIGLNLNPSQTSFLYKTTSDSISDIKSTKKNSIYGEFEIGYRFSRYLGFSTGLGFGSYSNALSLPSYSNSYKTTDSEGDSYQRTIRGSNIMEIQNITYIKIPVMGTVQIPFTEKIGLYIQTGVNFLISVKNKYNSSGTFSYSGYYSLFDVTITAVDHENFMNGQKADVSGKLNVKSFIPEWNSSAGFNYTVSDKIQISLGVTYSKILSDISLSSSVDSFQLSSDPNQMKSLMEGSSNVTAQSMGLKLGIRYYLK
jgi:hypothetical protein